MARTTWVSFWWIGLWCSACDISPAPIELPPDREPVRCDCPDDGIECTVELCDEAGECVHRPDDRACEGADECNLAACRPAEGGCTTVPRPTGAPCGDEARGGAPPNGCAQGECKPGRVVGLRTLRVLVVPDAQPISNDGFTMELARIDDRTGDGIDEIAVTSFRLIAFAPDSLPGRILAFDPATGEILWDSPGAEDNVAYGYRLQGIGDLNGDGLSDLVATERAGGAVGIDAVDGTTGQQIWRFAEPQASYMRFATAGDQDGDGVEDLVVVVGEGLATLSGATGEIIQSVAGAYGPNLYAVGDLDGDGHRDFICDSEPAVYRYVRVIGSATLSDLQVFDLPEEHVWVSGIVDDINGDGLPEGIVTHSDGVTRDREARDLVTGEVLWTQHYPRSAPLAIFDVDGDGIGDLLTDSRLESSPWRNLYFQSGADGSMVFEATPLDGHGAIAPIGTNYLQTGDLDGDRADDFAVGDQLTGSRVWLFTSIVRWF